MHIHIIGIGGIGTSGLAGILAEKGDFVSGSDIKRTDITDNLKKNGIKINIGHRSANVTKDMSEVIYSPAILMDNPEILAAKKNNVKIISYPEKLGEISSNHYTIAIAGTHGKSTTTAMIGNLLIDNEKDPTIIVGTKVPQLQNRNYRTGKSNIFVVEACEYKNSYLNLHPDILIITNIDLDHLDFFRNEKNYQKSFQRFADNIKDQGIIIISDEDAAKIASVKKRKIIISEKKEQKCDYYLNMNEKTLLNKKNDQKINLKLKILGEFNVKNASKASVLGNQLLIANKKIEQTLGDFMGTWRRQEIKLKKNSTTFYDDYAHHPNEIKSTLKAFRQANQTAKILCVFQPHQYSRTIKLFKDFGKSFHDCDLVIIPDIYQVRDSEKDITKIKAGDLIKEINKNSQNAIHVNGIRKTAEYIIKNWQSYNIIITMGAGDINKIYQYIEKSRL